MFGVVLLGVVVGAIYFIKGQYDLKKFEYRNEEIECMEEVEAEILKHRITHVRNRWVHEYYVQYKIDGYSYIKVYRGSKISTKDKKIILYYYKDNPENIILKGDKLIRKIAIEEITTGVIFIVIPILLYLFYLATSM